MDTTHSERVEAMDSHVLALMRQGYRIESRSEYSTVLVKGRRPNHLLHLILTIVTFGWWLFVWLWVAVLGGERRVSLHVDKFAQVHKRKA